MEESERLCALCGGPIEIGEAWLASARQGTDAVAHSGCVYGESMDPHERSGWMPPEVGSDT